MPVQSPCTPCEQRTLPAQVASHCEPLVVPMVKQQTCPLLHWLEPLHLPGEHVAFAPVPAGQTPRGSWFAGTGVHLPRLADWLQDTHVPVHAMSQQT